MLSQTSKSGGYAPPGRLGEDLNYGVVRKRDRKGGARVRPLSGKKNKRGLSWINIRSNMWRCLYHGTRGRKNKSGSTRGKGPKRTEKNLHFVRGGTKETKNKAGQERRQHRVSQNGLGGKEGRSENNLCRTTGTSFSPRKRKTYQGTRKRGSFEHGKSGGRTEIMMSEPGGKPSRGRRGRKVWASRVENDGLNQNFQRKKGKKKVYGTVTT